MSVLELTASPSQVIIGLNIQNNEIDVIEEAAWEVHWIVQVEVVIAGVVGVWNGISGDVKHRVELLVVPEFGKGDGVVLEEHAVLVKAGATILSKVGGGVHNVLFANQRLWVKVVVGWQVGRAWSLVHHTQGQRQQAEQCEVGNHLDD